MAGKSTKKTSTTAVKRTRVASSASPRPTGKKTAAAASKAKALAKAATPRAAKAAADPAPTGPARHIADATRRMIAAAAAACEEKKGEDTRILELDPMDAGFTDFFLITSGTNERQTQSIADEIELRLKREFQTYPNSVEGKRQGEWILLDYVDFVVHIFLAEKRAFYDIERLRKSAKNVDAAELQSALRKKTAASRKRVAAKHV